MLTAVSGRYGNTVTYVYDTAGRKLSESLTIDGQTYTTSTQYDAAGRVSKRMNSSVYDNGVSETRVYNTDNTLSQINFTGASIGNLSYTWDDNHNKTSEQITGTMSDYGFTASHDAEDRLTGWDRADTNLDQSWNLSAVGDWQKFTENAVIQNRTHGPAHELTAAGGQSVQHDAKGNMTLIQASLRSQTPILPLSLTWDFDNRLSSADVGNNGSVDVFYEFDALGRRVSRDDGTSTTVYVQNGQQTLADYASGAVPGSPTYTYVWGDYIDEPVIRVEPAASETLYYHRNQQYSVTALTSSTGAVVERYAYSAYGEPKFLSETGTVLTDSAKDNRYTYTGREWDKAIGFDHFRARMYDSENGRFCGRDPIRYLGSRWNLFEFLDSASLDAVDSLWLASSGSICYEVDWSQGEEQVSGKVCFALNKFCPPFIHFGPNSNMVNNGVVLTNEDYYVPWGAADPSFSVGYKNKKFSTSSFVEGHPCDRFSYRNCKRLTCSHEAFVKLYIDPGSDSFINGNPVRGRMIEIFSKTVTHTQSCCDGYERVWGVDPDSGELIPVKPCQGGDRDGTGDDDTSHCEG